MGRPALTPATGRLPAPEPAAAGATAPDGPAAPGAPALQLSWSERDLPQRERTRHVHGLHPYLGKYPPQLVEALLRFAFRPGQTVLDPFCGSGTTLVQANELGMPAVGVDVSAFNVLLVRAKTAVYDLPRLRAEVEDALTRATAGAATGAAAPEDPYLQSWFAPPALAQLLAYRAAIAAGGYGYADLLRIILSRAARSARLTTHFELDFPRTPQAEPYWCRKHRRVCRPASAALPFLRRYSADTLLRVAAFAAVRTAAAVAVQHADSRGADFPAADGIVTSPPYAGLIDYHAQHAYAYHLLDLVDRQQQEIGAPRAGSGRAARRGYQEDVALVLRRAAARLPAGAPILVVAADRHDLYPAVAGLAGLEPVDVLHRQVDRRTGLRPGAFFESIFVWRKP